MDAVTLGETAEDALAIFDPIFDHAPLGLYDYAPVKRNKAALMQLARKICAKHEGANKGYQYLDGSRDDYMPMHAVLEALTTERATLLAGQERAIAEKAIWQNAVLTTLAAVRAHMPPDGITAHDCLTRVVGAVDNPEINPLIEARTHD